MGNPCSNIISFTNIRHAGMQDRLEELFEQEITDRDEHGSYIQFNIDTNWIPYDNEILQSVADDYKADYLNQYEELSDNLYGEFKYEAKVLYHRELLPTEIDSVGNAEDYYDQLQNLLEKKPYRKV